MDSQNSGTTSNSSPKRRSVTVITMMATLLALIAVGGLGFLIGDADGHTTKQVHIPPVATRTLPDAPMTTRAVATYSALPTTTLTPPTDPLADAIVLTSQMCASTGTGCQQSTTDSFTTRGSFDVMYVCYHDYPSTANNAQLVMQLFNSAGRQVDVLSEACQGNTSSSGLISESQPAGTYTITVGATTGPSWVIVALQGAGSAGS